MAGVTEARRRDDHAWASASSSCLREQGLAATCPASRQRVELSDGRRIVTLIRTACSAIRTDSGNGSPRHRPVGHDDLDVEGSGLADSGRAMPLDVTCERLGSMSRTFSSVLPAVMQPGNQGNRRRSVAVGILAQGEQYCPDRQAELLQ